MIRSEEDFFEIKVEKSGESLRGFLSRYKLSRRLFNRFFKEGKIYVNGGNERKGHIVNAGDLVRVYYGNEDNKIIPEDMDLDILYEDSNLLIVNKPCGQVVHPIKYYFSQTLLNGVKAYFKKRQINRDPRLVNRLDKDTEGLVIIAKNPYIDSLMSELIKRGEVTRKYILIVDGEMETEFGEINKPILKIEGEMERKIHPTGQESLTKYRLINKNKRYSLVEAQLLTGRSHQIRIHFKSIGHSIVSDPIYGEYKECNMYLCSYYLRFKNPITGEDIEIILSDKLEEYKRALDYLI